MDPLKPGEAAAFVPKLARLTDMYSPKASRSGVMPNDGQFQKIEIAVAAARSHLAKLLAWAEAGRQVDKELGDARRMLAEAEQRALDVRLIGGVIQGILEETRDAAREETPAARPDLQTARKTYEARLAKLDRNWKTLTTPDIRREGAELEVLARKAGCWQTLKTVVLERFQNRPRGDALVDLYKLT